MKASQEQRGVLGNNTTVSSGGTKDNPISLLQNPQLDEDGDGIATKNDGTAWLNRVRVNGNFGEAGANYIVFGNLPVIPTPLPVGQPTLLKIQTSAGINEAKRVWALLRPPRMSLVTDTNGTPILSFPAIELSRTTEPHTWEAAWNWDNTMYNGNYEVTFYAQDNQGNIASSQSMIVTVTGGTESPPQAAVQIVLNQEQYQRGEHFQAQLREDLGWGYDLYAAVVLPDGNFMALTNTNDLALVNDPKNWQGQRVQHSSISLFDLTLPDTLPTGQYCLYGILSPENENVFKTLEKGLWVSEQKCFEIVP